VAKIAARFYHRDSKFETNPPWLEYLFQGFFGLMVPKTDDNLT